MSRIASRDAATPELTRPQRYEARRRRATERLAQGWAKPKIAEALGVSAEAVRSCRLAWAQGGTDALRRRQASGRPPALSPEQTAAITQALLAGATANGFDNDRWTLDRVVQVVQRTTGIRLSRLSAWPRRRVRSCTCCCWNDSGSRPCG